MVLMQQYFVLALHGAYIRLDGETYWGVPTDSWYLLRGASHPTAVSASSCPAGEEG